jgi:hypothetical protein
VSRPHATAAGKTRAENLQSSADNIAAAALVFGLEGKFGHARENLMHVKVVLLTGLFKLLVYSSAW